MFKKVICINCKKKTSKDYKFCPECGHFLKDSKKDWGMLGKEDEIQDIEPPSNSFFGGINEKFLGKMLGGAMKMLEKEMEKDMKKSSQAPFTNFKIVINGREIKSGGQQRVQQKEKKYAKKIDKLFSQVNLKKFQESQKQEPATDIRRFSDKIIYEIFLPGVNSMDNISISELGNSIEVRAVGKNKAYFKSIPINLPVIGYGLNKSKFTLEFGEK